MKFHLILALLVAPLAALVGQYSAPLGLVGWVVFLTWAAFFATEGGKDGLIKVLLGAMVGLLGGYAVVELAAMSTMSNPILLPLAVTIFVFVVLGQFSFFFAPAAFIGCASYMGAGALFWETFISLLLGVALAFATKTVAAKIAGQN